MNPHPALASSDPAAAGHHARQLTFRYERWRAFATGILETASGTFLLLIAVRHFEAGATAKAVITMGFSGGLLFSPLIVTALSALGWRSSRGAAGLTGIGGGGMLTAALFPTLPVFIGGTVLGLMCFSSAIPLFTQMYQDNYPSHERGRLFSRTVMIRIVMSGLFSGLAGRFLATHFDQFQWLLMIFAGCMFFSSWCLWRCPSKRLHKENKLHPLRTLRALRDDSAFRNLLICWMLMGFGNLMMIPLRVEYLANPRYGLNLSAGMIALLTGVLPNLSRLLLSPVWGRLFDHMNFFAMRIVLNAGFVIGILSFFTGNSMTGLVIGAFVFGISQAGGEVAWSLWVTKVAPSHRVAEYMAVHTCFTGIRGVLAPLIAFHAVATVSMPVLGSIAAGLIVLASVMLVPEGLASRRRPLFPPV